MIGFHDDHIIQSEEELRHLEDDHAPEGELTSDPGASPADKVSPSGPERQPTRRDGSPGGLGDLPKPLYRIRATHSNETFFAYFATGTHPVQVPVPQSTGPAVAEPPAPPVVETDAAETPCQSQVEVEPEAPAEKVVPELSEQAPGHGAITALLPRTMVVAPTRYGRDLCELQGVVMDAGSVGRDEIVKIERVATADDLKKAEANREREAKAFDVCRQKIAARNLPMKLVSAHYLIDELKVLFYFSAESRVDFRELVKDLVAVFKMRIELRQIGVRDEARVIGGCGVCGRVLCCHGVTDKLTPVSIKMAKDQNLSLNSMKISGPCGRLLCCLAYEYGFYRDARRELPNEGARFQFEGTLFRVIEVNALSGSVKMAGEDGRVLDMASSRFALVEGRWQIKPATPQA